MPEQASLPNDQPGKRTAPKRSYRVIQDPAKPGTITLEQALEAALWVKQQRARTRPA